MKRRKPDIMIVLAVVIGIGVLATSYAQGLIQDAQPAVTISSK